MPWKWQNYSICVPGKGLNDQSFAQIKSRKMQDCFILSVLPMKRITNKYKTLAFFE